MAESERIEPYSVDNWDLTFLDERTTMCVLVGDGIETLPFRSEILLLGRDFLFQFRL